jgi:hypothetical protein
MPAAKPGSKNLFLFPFFLVIRVRLSISLSDPNLSRLVILLAMTCLNSHGAAGTVSVRFVAPGAKHTTNRFELLVIRSDLSRLLDPLLRTGTALVAGADATLKNVGRDTDHLTHPQQVLPPIHSDIRPSRHIAMSFQ